MDAFERRIANTAVGFGNKPLAAVGLRIRDRAAQEEIRHHAYKIWESKGRCENTALDDWLEAEAKVLMGSAR